jgi:hypothetical protein
LSHRGRQIRSASDCTHPVSSGTALLSEWLIVLRQAITDTFAQYRTSSRYRPLSGCIVKLGKQSSKEQAHFSRNDLDKFQQFFSKMSGRGGD